MIQAEDALYQNMAQALDRLFTNMGKPRPREKEKAAFGEAAGEVDLLQLHRTMEEHNFQVGLSYARALGLLEGRVKSVAQDLLFGADPAGAAIRLGEAIREAEALLEEGARNDT